jgi:hypothetical protein
MMGDGILQLSPYEAWDFAHVRRSEQSRFMRRGAVKSWSVSQDMWHRGAYGATSPADSPCL